MSEQPGDNSRKVTGAMVKLQQVSLDLKTAIAAIVTVGIGVAATVGGLHMIGTDIRREMATIAKEQGQAMKDLDDKWQARSTAMEERIRLEIIDLRRSLPTPATIQRFEYIEQRLTRLEGKLDGPSPPPSRD